MEEKVSKEISIATLVLFIPAVLYQGLILTKLWLWFFVPLGLPIITIPLAIGITLTVGFFSKVGKPAKNDTEALTQLLMFFIRPTITVGMAYIIQTFI